METRRCGVLIHPTSFPSPFGIGDFGKEARDTLMMLAKAKVSLWQILPLGPTGYGDSPYAARSTFAGNELLIDLRSLDQMVSLGKTYLDPENRTTGRVDYNSVYAYKMPLLKEAAQLFIDGKSSKDSYKAFCTENAWWLDDYALYQALVNHFNDSRWFMWEEGLKTRKKTVLAKWRKTLAPQIEVYKVLQFFFFTQWNDLHKFANGLGIKIIGDIPIYVAGDSVDAWTNPRLFKIDAQGNQTAQAGCPPDAFTAEGQLWGNPVYNWGAMKADGYSWWKKRLEISLRNYDVLRIDHFRGFDSFYCIPFGSPDAKNGCWREGPGAELFFEIRKEFGELPIIAEDLGFLTDSVRRMLSDVGFPGMKILQFAFDSRGGNDDYLPHKYERNTVVYTGTHDNDTILGWKDAISREDYELAKSYIRCGDEGFAENMMLEAMSTVANTCILTMQDLLGLDGSGRMNEPSTVGKNWKWRALDGQISQRVSDFLKHASHVYHRENPQL